jgi:hypothetical protein
VPLAAQGELRYVWKKPVQRDAHRTHSDPEILGQRQARLSDSSFKPRITKPKLVRDL